VAIKYARGTIIFVAQVPDPNNANPKDRRVILIRDFDESDPHIYGVAVTGTFTFPLPPTSVRLPYHRQGRCKTGLTKDCVADCTWIVVATPAEIIKAHGITPPIQLATILQQVQNYLPPPPVPPAPPSGPTGS
jgi:hypothetical protein